MSSSSFLSSKQILTQSPRYGRVAAGSNIGATPHLIESYKQNIRNSGRRSERSVRPGRAVNFGRAAVGTGAGSARSLQQIAVDRVVYGSVANSRSRRKLGYRKPSNRSRSTRLSQSSHCCSRRCERHWPSRASSPMKSARQAPHPNSKSSLAHAAGVQSLTRHGFEYLTTLQYLDAHCSAIAMAILGIKGVGSRSLSTWLRQLRDRH